jgi:hypothetical protein
MEKVQVDTISIPVLKLLAKHAYIERTKDALEMLIKRRKDGCSDWWCSLQGMRQFLQAWYAQEDLDACLFEAVKTEDGQHDGGAQVRTLLALGASKHAKSCYGQSPLHLAVLSNIWNKTDAPRDRMQVLLNACADPNIRDERGETPLHIAARSAYKSEEMTRLLLDAGVNKDIKNNEGSTKV